MASICQHQFSQPTKPLWNVNATNAPSKTSTVMKANPIEFTTTSINNLDRSKNIFRFEH